MDPLEGQVRQVLGDQSVDVVVGDLEHVDVLEVVGEDLPESLIGQTCFHAI